MASPPQVKLDVSQQLDGMVKLSESMRNGTLGAREDLVKACRSLLNTVESPSERVWRLLWGEPSHHLCVRIATELKIWQHLAADGGSPKSSEELASMCSASPVLVRRLMKHLAAMDSVTEVDIDRFSNTPMSSLFEHDEYVNSVRLVNDYVIATHHKAVDYFKQIQWQNPSDIRDTAFQLAFDCKGQTFFEWGAVNGDPPLTFLFGQMLTAWSQGRRHWMDDNYYPVEERLAKGAMSDKDAVMLVDIGGSHGHDLEQFKAKHPHVPGRLILQDVPDIISQLKPSDVFEATVHDFFSPQPVKGARAYYMHSILHDWNDGDCRKILQNLTPALERGYSRVLVQEMVVPDKGAHWQLTSLDWELLVHFAGQERTESEWRALIESAGLLVTGIFKHPHSQDSLLEIGLP